MTNNIKLFKAEHVNCALRIAEMSEPRKVHIYCSTHSKYETGFVPHEECFNLLKCAGEGTCREDPACNN